MQQSYTKNYVNIYIFQILSILLGFTSVFVVIPFISSNPTIYGIYSVCTSVSIFLQYADLGFLNAGQKYAAESYAKQELKIEMQLIGFSHFILLVFIVLISLLFVVISFNPHWLIKGISAGVETQTAQQLMLILAIFAPVIVGQRALQIIFGIRLQDHKLQKLSIIGNSIKILSAFYFFTQGRYNIVGYFLFMQFLSLFVVIAGAIYAKRSFNYNFKSLLKNLKFDPKIFKQTKSLAFASLFATISWITYYELDSIAIGSMLGAKSVAIYAVGFALLTFVRSIFGVLFSPFASRFNHFVGANQHQELLHFYKHVMIIMFPLVVFPLVGSAIMAKGIVISWVGVEYEESVSIARWLILCNIVAFITYPTNLMLMAYNKISKINLISVILPFVFWIGVLTTYKKIGIESFALFKFSAFAISGCVNFYFASQLLGTPVWKLVKTNILPFIPAIIVMIFTLYFVNDTFADQKSKLNLLINTGLVMGSIIVAILVSLVTVQPLRAYVKRMFGQYKKSKNES